ncbi:TetR/AcrR family transcriptional regulator [Streptomyces sp. NPDC093225]|uniref:TetR/AcrR family transcriptional regulator n=1 Tax=Streptomyces sp. NPDC093225 TaxID=3366034 RepID=UPI00382D8F5C
MAHTHGTPDPDAQARALLLDAAEELFYAHGIQAVGMDRVRERSGVPLKRLYRVFPSKEALVAAYLERRDRRWIDDLTAYVTALPEPRERVLGVFDWLGDWFAEPGFRGCAFLNAFGELGEASEPVAVVVRTHKARLHALLTRLAEAAGGPPELADQLVLLVEGATVRAALATGDAPPAAPATTARGLAAASLAPWTGAGATG